MPVTPAILTLICAVSLAGCDRAAPDDAQPQQIQGAAITGEIDASQAGTLMPAATILDPADAELNLAAMQGQPVLVNLWATWCAPCVVEMPLLDTLAQDYAGRLRVVTVSQDHLGADKVEPFFAARDFAMLEPWLDPAGGLADALGAEGLPLTVLYDASGMEVWRVAGDYDWASAEAREAIEAALE